jgi:rare lipoprotein A
MRLAAAVGVLAFASPLGVSAPAQTPIHRNVCAETRPKEAAKRPKEPTKRFGLATWYGIKFHNKLMANGKRFNQWALTAAHKTLPLGTKVKVTNVLNDKSVVVLIQDRGPFASRLWSKKPPRPVADIDLSLAAAQQIDMVKHGVVPVKIEILS